ncbi:SDR family NAD(P)-dependent oxidoreductase [Pseudorhizobium marinum]|uniref:SDR family NAD(P)-dependent oxidoreductase n=1 Tax=Pseudorhizobium marinum TaxID=1496690 RepID=UPI0004972FD1|nr:glucose 1-dehydrogenase [Pseudorhizobium marinum]
MQKLTNKVAVVTGGNSGIGKATAALFAREGAQVIITGRRKAVLDSAVEEIGHGALGIQGDVADLEHHAEVAAKVHQLFGAADIYIANAGIINLTTSDKVSPEEYDKHFAVNTRGVFFGVQHILPVMRDGGNIVITSSLAATRVLPNHTVYAGAKAAVAAFARNWALELRDRKIRVNILSPGPTDTAILAKLGVSDADRPSFEADLARTIPAGRLGLPEELANAALFLASDTGSFVNGIELNVDGGMLIA